LAESGNAGHTGRFAVPRLSPDFIQRPRLLRHVDQLREHPLLSLTGPAGSGKSVLAAQWCRQCALPVAWMQLPRDQTSEQLVEQLSDALGFLAASAAPDGRRPHSHQRGGPDPAAVDPWRAALTGAPPSVLVLDGMRVSGPLDVYSDLAAALQEAPDCRVHLLAISRGNLPQHPNPLRLSGVLPHLGGSELALDVDETASLVEVHSGRPVDAGVAAELTARLDGWMAGTVITALARPPGDDATIDELLDAAADGIEEYVGAEILSSLPPDVTTFLHATSVLDGLTAPLCDHVTERDDSDKVLQTMRRDGLPIHRIPSAVGTFRYAGWLRRVLATRHRREGPAGPARSLRRAGEWFEANDRPIEAAECLVQLQDWGELERVLTLHLTRLLGAADIDRLSGLLASIPRSVRVNRVELGLNAACVEMMAGRVSAAFEELALSEAGMNPDQRMRADVIRAASVAWVEDPLVPLAAAESAIEACDDLGDDYEFANGHVVASIDLYRTSARSSALMAAAYAGRWDDGRRHLVALSSETAQRELPVLALRRLVSRSVFLAVAGDLGAASAVTEAALALATECDLGEHPFSSGLFFAVGELHRLAGRLEAALPAIERGLAIARDNRRRNLVAASTGSLAALLVDSGRAPAALDLVEQHRSSRRHRPPPTPAAMLAAAEARALGAIGEHRLAMKVLRQAPSSSTTAAVGVATALATGDVAGARETIERWPAEKTAIATLRRGLALAMTLDTMGVARESQAVLRSTLAAADELLQPIAEFGAPMARLLRRVYRYEHDSAAADVARRVQALVAGGGAVAPRLTERESVVLEHLDRGLPLPAIAVEARMSVNTVKTHVKSIYRKLGASSRADALEAWRSRPTGRD
jgi:LuxR family maltose regulon positive regulatory protein